MPHASHASSVSKMKVLQWGQRIFAVDPKLEVPMLASPTGIKPVPVLIEEYPPVDELI